MNLHLAEIPIRCTSSNIFPAEIYLFKVKNGNTRKICEICPQLTIKVLERRQNMFIVEIKIRSVVLIDDLEQISPFDHC